MINLHGLYMAVVFLWWFRLQVVPLSLGTSYSLTCGVSCVTHQKNFTRAVTVTINGPTRKRQYSLSNSNLALCEAKAICGTTSPRVTVLALFYELVNRLMETKEIEKNKNKNNRTTKTNWTKELKPQTRQKLMQFVPTICGSLILCLILVY